MRLVTKPQQFTRRPPHPRDAGDQAWRWCLPAPRRGHRGGMGGGFIGLIIFVVIVILIACAVFVVIPLARRQQQISNEVNAPETPTLDYEVPVGQDPAAVVAALHGDGYVATVDPRNTQIVKIACPTGVDRERARVRAVIQGAAGSTAIDFGEPVERRDVRFLDER